MNPQHLAAATLIAVAGIMAAGCSHSNSSANAAGTDSAANTALPDTLTFDTVRFEQKNSAIYSSVALDYPNTDTPIAKAVRQFINSKLADISLLYTEAVPGEGKRKEYSGDITSPSDMMRYYTKGNAKFLNSLHDDDIETYSQQSQMQYCCNIEIRKASECSKFITYDTSVSTFYGGAHGSFVCTSNIISKLSNEALKYTVDPSKVKELQPLIRKGIIEYFHECNETNVNESNLLENLMLGEGVTQIPLPTSTPSFTDKGVTFTYQQYEIACYAVGLVCFTIPYSKIKPYLTPAARDLID